MRSKRRFRQLFVIVGVMALANGVVAAYQTELSPGQLASWGPGYKELIKPTNAGTGRIYFSEGEAAARFWTTDLTADYVRLNADYRT